MKKVITLLFSLGLFATSFAQYDQRKNDNGWNKRNDEYATSNRQYDSRWNDNVFSARERDFQIDKINRDFNYKVDRIRNDRFMRRREKRFAIREAENERAKQIQWVNATFRSQFHKGYERHDRDKW